MTVLLVICLIAAFLFVPFLAGNVYGFILRKKNMGIVSTYLTGVVLIYACLTVIQLAIIKFKFDFNEAIKIYHILFLGCIVLGVIGFALRKRIDNAIRWEVTVSKKSMWVLALILLQGIFYIGCKNPYFENNALLETVKITMETGTIYEYNAFSLKEAVAGFPLSNKLMVLPVFYAYVSTVFGCNPVLVFNFVAPVVTFISFYMVMLLWTQILGKEYEMKWELILALLVFTVQVGDGWSHATAFRILHTGYMGEAIFFGVILPYTLYAIKNKRYLIAMICIATFPGLIKYDALLDLLKGIKGYWQESASCGGMMLVYVLSVIYYIASNKKVSTHLLNLNLTIAYSVSCIWKVVMEKECTKWCKVQKALVILVVLLLCGNVMPVSDVTEFRSNVYGADKKEYELLEWIEKQTREDEIEVMACDEVGRWIRRADFDMVPVIGYDFGGKDVQWYSYEKYDETHMALWESIHNTTPYLEDELMEYVEKIEMDYIVMKRITEDVPITGNTTLKCVYETPSYLVYFVDKN